MERYRALLSGANGLSLNAEPDGTVNGYWMPSVVFDRDTGVTREMLISAFQEGNIDARVFFWPLSELPMFDARPGNFIAHDISSRSINLPSYHDMDETAQARVADVIIRLASA